ncbi:YjfB family protein [Achromobacter sp. F4_2707]|uniref:YjfB family protein n=1 Tax=Achromobacter sp. F4_2707 TaxID=3114286 RepID=UPI0039C69C0C
MSIEATVGAALALENFNAHQSAQMNLLRETLDTQARTVTEIVEAATPKLATSGHLGTNVNTYA